MQTAETTETKVTLKASFYGRGGTLVCGNLPVESLDEARVMAARWNRDEERPGMKVEIIRGSNGHVTSVAW